MVPIVMTTKANASTGTATSAEKTHRSNELRHFVRAAAQPRRKLRSFGVNDKPACMNCSKPMSLTRRSPDADDLNYARQTFTCQACDHLIERIVDTDGNSSE